MSLGEINNKLVVEGEAEFGSVAESAVDTSKNNENVEAVVDSAETESQETVTSSDSEKNVVKDKEKNIPSNPNTFDVNESSDDLVSIADSDDDARYASGDTTELGTQAMELIQEEETLQSASTVFDELKRELFDVSSHIPQDLVIRREKLVQFLNKVEAYFPTLESYRAQQNDPKGQELFKKKEKKYEDNLAIAEKLVGEFLRVAKKHGHEEQKTVVSKVRPVNPLDVLVDQEGSGVVEEKTDIRSSNDINGGVEEKREIDTDMYDSSIQRLQPVVKEVARTAHVSRTLLKSIDAEPKTVNDEEKKDVIQQVRKGVLQNNNRIGVFARSIIDNFSNGFTRALRKRSTVFEQKRKATVQSTHGVDSPRTNRINDELDRLATTRQEESAQILRAVQQSQ
jgi:hypothetical protein